YWATPPANFAPFNAFQDLTTLPRPAYTEDFDDLSLDDSSPDYFAKRVNGNSALVVLTTTAAEPNIAVESSTLDSGGEPGAPVTTDDYAPNVPDTVDPDKRTGLSALLLDAYRDVALVYAPGQIDKGIRTAIISHCENQKFRFAVLDCDSSKSNTDPELDPRT